MKHISDVMSGYRQVFLSSPAAMLIIDADAPVYTILDVNEAYLAATNSSREALVGHSVFAAFPANPTDEVSKNIERTIYSFEQAISTKIPHTMRNYRYDIPIRGTDEFEERYWTTSNSPILDEDGNVRYFIHSPENVTELFKLAERERASVEALRTQRQLLFSIFMQAPVGIAIFRGPDFIVDLINPPLCELYGKTAEEMLGKPVFTVLHHAKGMGFEELLNGVRLTGQSFKGVAFRAPLMRNDKLETVYLDFVYEPYREDDGTISGVIAVAVEVTEQEKAKIQMAESEERSRLAIDAAGLGTFDLNLATGESITSTIFANIFGFEQPVSRKEYEKVFHPDDIAVRNAAHRLALKTGVLFYEVRVIWPDNTIRWVRVEGKVFYHVSDKPYRILGTLLDITKERKANEEQQKLITLVANSVDLMSVLNMDGINSYINEAGKKLLGFESDDHVVRTPIYELHTPEDFEFVQREILPTVLNKGQWAGEMKVKHLKTGEVFPVFNNCIRIDDPLTGLQIGTGAVMRDLRPELAAKKALADSERLLRDITTATPTGLWMADKHGAMIYVNQTWTHWTGFSHDQFFAKGWLDSIVAEDKIRAEENFIRCLSSRELYEDEFRINHTDGTIHWCIATGRPQYDADGEFSGYIGAYVDITVQKQLQRQKDDFIAIASHELKTPVTSIKAYTQVLERILEKKGENREVEMVRRMDGQINRLTSLIGDLLDVTKINSGKLQFNDAAFDFTQYVHGVVEDLQLTTLRHEIVGRFLPVGSVFGDKERIGQVVANLITNAIKYSPQASKIVVSTELRESEVILSVQDFGIGISNDNLNKVFEQFYRVSGEMQHTFPGLGLGLYISSEIIKREGGKIWVTSEEGMGSTFCFSLPSVKQ